MRPKPPQVVWLLPSEAIRLGWDNMIRHDHDRDKISLGVTSLAVVRCSAPEPDIEPLQIPYKNLTVSARAAESQKGSRFWLMSLLTDSESGGTRPRLESRNLLTLRAVGDFE